MFNIYDALGSGIGRAVLTVVGGAISIAIGMAVQSVEDTPQTIEYATVEIDGQRQLVLFGNDVPVADMWMIQYALLQDGAPLLEDALLGGTNQDPATLNFSVVSAADGDLIGLVEANYPDRLLLTLQLSTQQVWPQLSVPAEAGVPATTQHVEQLRRANPGRSFIHLGLVR